MGRNKKIVVGLVILGAILSIFFYQLSAPRDQAEPERFVIKLDTSQSKLISKLYSQGFVKNRLAFKVWLTVRSGLGEVEPGSYMISKKMSGFKLAEVLVNHPYQKWVQIPEGLRKEEIAEIVQQQLNWSQAEKNNFLSQAKEGYLFPETYLFNVDFSGQEVAKRMTNRFNEKVADLFLEAKKNNIRNDTLIVLASLVQREAATEKEMPLIAGIIWNRWLNDMPFEIDATVQYALGKPGEWWPTVKPDHYQLDSPYNTYAHKGRPPAPICNPGLAAIKAVILSKDTDFLYYLHDPQGKIHCAKTEQQHWQNVDRYLVFPWVYQQPKLDELSSAEVNSILKELKDRFPDPAKRLKALSILRLGTPYDSGCLGEEAGRDQDPIFRLDLTDCTAFVLTNVALLHSKNLEQAQQMMKSVNYRSPDQISFGGRLHFTTDRNQTSPYFEDITQEMAEDEKIRTREIILNKKRRDGTRLIDIDWEKKITEKYIPSQYIEPELFENLPRAVGVAFVKKGDQKIGLDVRHEGLLFRGRDFIHASSAQGKVVRVSFLDYYFDRSQEPRFDGVLFYKIK